jgi:filamentous hemagglutinin
MPDAAMHPDALPNACDAIIEIRKITGCALNPDHPIGGAKARVFATALGYTNANMPDLVAAIRLGILSCPAVRGLTDAFGTRYIVDMPMTGPAGRAVVRTGWIVEIGMTTPRLVTLYVK